MLVEQQVHNHQKYRDAFRQDERVKELAGVCNGTVAGNYILISAKRDHLVLPLESEAPDGVIDAVRIYLDATALNVA